MAEGKTGLFLLGAVVAALGLAAGAAVYVRSRPLAQPYTPPEDVAAAAAENPGEERVADVLSADDNLDEALSDLEAVNF